MNAAVSGDDWMAGVSSADECSLYACGKEGLTRSRLGVLVESHSAGTHRQGFARRLCCFYVIRTARPGAMMVMRQQYNDHFSSSYAPISVPRGLRPPKSRLPRLTL